MIKNTTIYSKKLLKEYEAIGFTARYKKVRLFEIGFIIFLILYNFFVNRNNITFTILYLMALMVFTEIAFRIVSWSTFIRNNRRMLNHEIIYTFQKDQLHIKSNTRNEILRYATIYRVIETDKAFYLYETKKDAYLIDKQSFTDEELNQIKEDFHHKRINLIRKYSPYL